jgi:beta-xylosidase
MKYLSLLSLLALMALPLSSQTLSDADLKNAYTTQTYAHRISCHDPSIVMDNVTDPAHPVYYVYGSHLGHGSTTVASNYLDWDASWAGDESATSSNSLFANANGDRILFGNAYGNAHSWQYTGNSVQGMQWAPDIIYNKTMKKWCLYMSLNGDNWCSSIVLFTSDSPKGPWVNNGVVVYSGFSGRFDHVGYTNSADYKQTDLEKVLGPLAALPDRYNIPQSRTTSWGNIYPNNIDPCVFFDDDNNLWMSYGSWSGGIFMLKLDKTTGLRDYTQTYDYKTDKTVATVGANYNVLSDPYFGKKIAGGYYVSGEGSYIQKIGKYYFLFMSYGGLNPSQGYQIRVFRSEKPDGPYVDANGTSAIYDKYAQNYGSNATDNRGVLLMEGYQWETMPKGEVAQGHNSAFIDAQGRAFVVYHTKFNDGTFGHEVRIHQLFLNEDGWLVAAPYEFKGETATNADIAGKASVADADIPGTYQFIRHQYGQSHAAVSSDNQATTAKLTTPVNITLSTDGTVSGSGISGTWTRKAGTDFITITINSVSYKGVLVNQTLDYTNIPALCIAAVSDDSGVNGSGAAQTRQQEIWASKADAKAAIKYTLDRLEIPFTDRATINRDVLLPLSDGHLGASISWKSSDENVYDDDFGEPVADGPVTLTLNISKDGYVYSKAFNLTVDMDGTVSGISSIHSGKSFGDGRVYNLNGQQVGPAYHGIVIKNGRKIIQK